MKKLGSILDGENNSFNLLRLLAALLVVISHSFEIPVGPDAIQPLDGPTPFNLGAHAVNAFFIISGLTLSNSITKNPDLIRFVTARCLRIFPGLIAFGFVFAFVLGPAVTTAPLQEYFSDARAYLYPFAILLDFGDATPPLGVFEQNPVAGMVNDPLWTIRYELAAYFGFALLVVTGLFKSRIGLVLSCAAVIAYFGLFEVRPGLGGEVHGFASIARFGFCFMLGVVAFSLRDRIVLSSAALLAAGFVLWLLSGTPLARAGYLLFTGYFVFVIGSLSFGALSRWTRRTDISYGTYLYGWPIQQTLIFAMPGIGIGPLMIATLALAPFAGLLSWVLVEKRALSLKRRSVQSSHELARSKDRGGLSKARTRDGFV
ncbi:acyltransferase family protein [Flaviflagellibacter deserti]|uniref:Acyltransferase family protein n=1 Tax=Flaviflagellibacter deserti TaxID=2267266 RepID=A0ABV9Z201_9HYPH